ncbi:hypothetical protein GT346_06035 [Streptomyces sp. SID161]|nr:hypothetical protein [Streptomyces sp. SID161]
MPSTAKIGNVSEDRYEQIVERLGEAAEKSSKSSFIIGDGAWEVVPMQEHGGRSVGDDSFGVSAWLHRLSDDIDVPYDTIMTYRWVATKGPPLFVVVTPSDVHDSVAAPKSSSGCG